MQYNQQEVYVSWEVILLFKDNFSRYEFKFPISYATMYSLLEDLKPYTEKDVFGDSDGWYTISSIYFDNDFKQCFYETINGENFREKLRLRTYNKSNSDSICYFEIKMKIKGLVRKRRIKMKLANAMNFIDDCVNKRDIDLDKVESSNKQILKEIKYLIDRKSLIPVNVVSYDRLALFAKDDEELRITFDARVRTRGENLDLTAGDYGVATVDHDTVILELKTNKNLPYWLVAIISKYGYKNQTFSKYCSHYKDIIKGETVNAG